MMAFEFDYNLYDSGSLSHHKFNNHSVYWRLITEERYIQNLNLLDSIYKTKF